MNLNITILEDNKQDYLLLSEEILHWAETEGHSANITQTFLFLSPAVLYWDPRYTFSLNHICLIPHNEIHHHRRSL